jgi:hypothetical protein
MALKSSDQFAIYACSSCHDSLDKRSGYDNVANPNIYEDMLRALEETQEQMISEELMVIL